MLGEDAGTGFTGSMTRARMLQHAAYPGIPVPLCKSVPGPACLPPGSFSFPAAMAATALIPCPGAPLFEPSPSFPARRSRKGVGRRARAAQGTARRAGH